VREGNRLLLLVRIRMHQQTLWVLEWSLDMSPSSLEVFLRRISRFNGLHSLHLYQIRKYLPS
jgi:DNA/RNA-binding domain of Phe-tRNA-synthetase-like protein